MSIIQKHHIKYKERDGEEWTVPIFKGEHFICTKISIFCRKKVSVGFITALKYFIETREKEAIEAK